MDPAQVVIAVAQQNTRLHVPPDTDPVLKKIIKQVWEENPDKRSQLLIKLQADAPYRITMAAIVTKLDLYLSTLRQMYEDELSQDEDADPDREYFRAETDAASTPKSHSKGGKKRKELKAYGSMPENL